MTGLQVENYSTGNLRLKSVVITALIRCTRGLMSSFLSCLIFPRMVNHHVAHSRKSWKAQVICRVDWSSTLLGGAHHSQNIPVTHQSEIGSKQPFFFLYKILPGTLEVSNSYKSQTELQNCHSLFPSDNEDVVISSILDDHKGYFKIHFWMTNSTIE